MTHHMYATQVMRLYLSRLAAAAYSSHRHLSGLCRCLCYGPPGATMSPALAEYCKPFTLSFIIGRDLVPRLSIPVSVVVYGQSEHASRIEYCQPWPGAPVSPPYASPPTTPPAPYSLSAFHTVPPPGHHAPTRRGAQPHRALPCEQGGGVPVRAPPRAAAGLEGAGRAHALPARPSAAVGTPRADPGESRRRTSLSHNHLDPPTHLNDKTSLMSWSWRYSLSLISLCARLAGVGGACTAAGAAHAVPRAAAGWASDLPGQVAPGARRLLREDQAGRQTGQGTTHTATARFCLMPPSLPPSSWWYGLDSLLPLLLSLFWTGSATPPPSCSRTTCRRSASPPPWPATTCPTTTSTCYTRSLRRTSASTCERPGHSPSTAAAATAGCEGAMNAYGSCMYTYTCPQTS